MKPIRSRLSGDQTAIFYALLLCSPLIGVAIMTGVILRFI